MAVDWDAVERIARGEARKLTRNPADVDELQQAGLVRAVVAAGKAPEGQEQKYAAQGARWGVLDEARRLWKLRVKADPGRSDPAVAMAERLRRQAERRAQRALLMADVPRARDVLLQLYRFAISQAGGSVEVAAAALGVGRATLYRAVAAHPDLLATTPAEPEPATRAG